MAVENNRNSLKALKAMFLKRGGKPEDGVEPECMARKNYDGSDERMQAECDAVPCEVVDILGSEAEEIAVSPQDFRELRAIVKSLLDRVRALERGC